ncbi:MAG: transcription factor S [Candidatus Aenigmatarchaeota archaeon]
MDFCDKCGGLLIPKKSGKKVKLVCRKCGKVKTKKKVKGYKIPISTKKPEKIIIVSKKHKFEALPKTTAQCPKCEHNKAYWWMQQTRAGDEAPTRFYKCVKCKHIWREYE